MEENFSPWDRKKIKHESEHHDDCCESEKDRCKKGNTRESAFRAINLINQTVPADTFVKVLYQSEQFDIANEYDPANSIFIPKTNGVYSIIATIAFSPNSTTSDYRAGIQIRVNGNSVAADNDFFGANAPFTNEVTVSTILELEAGDLVEIFAVSSVAGVIVQDGVNQNSTHFEAARFPSPAR
ncbi:ABC transporter permease [Priestia megaterium]|uniref:ABC transporter permease n=1 Tax=Priestia megaterium TaxID=1404 RepID=UPI003D9F2C2E